MNCDQKVRQKKSNFWCQYTGSLFFIPQLSPPSDELALQTNSGMIVENVFEV